MCQIFISVPLVVNGLAMMKTSDTRVNAPSSIHENNILFSPKSPEAIYVHIPFCRKRCYYCDFAIVPVGNKQHESDEDKFLDLANTYSSAILTEIRLLKESQELKNQTFSPLRSIYVSILVPFQA